MLDHCGFHEKWRRWVFFCIFTVKFSILINGTPCDFFESSRGIRQGDPLSPLLFVIVTNAFSKMLDKAMRDGLMSGFRVGPTGNSLQLSPLLLVDDTLVLCDADLGQILFLWLVLFWFEVVSGLNINMDKSELVPVGMVPNIADMVDVLGCKQGSFPMQYLGLPLDANVRDRSVWNPIIEKVERRLAGWKRLYLSKGGKVTLIKSTLSNLPTYFLSFSYPSRGCEPY